MPIRKPNFFIVGAPKCGTTSLAAWLDGHPEVTMSRPKEPHFFSPRPEPAFATLDEYEACFAHAEPHHRAIGEASTHTMYFPNAVRDMIAYNSQAKFIVCLRNPVDMAISLHNYMLFFGEQPVHDLQEAWQSRAELRPMYLDRPCASGAFYRFVCALGTHYGNLRAIVPGDRILTLLLDDLIMDEATTLRMVTDFLDIAPSNTPFPRENAARTYRSPLLRRVAGSLARVKRQLGVEASLGVGRWIHRRNIAAGSGVYRPTPEVRAMLAEHFAPEITRLERALDRDLSHWRVQATNAVVS